MPQDWLFSKTASSQTPPITQISIFYPVGRPIDVVTTKKTRPRSQNRAVRRFNALTRRRCYRGLSRHFVFAACGGSSKFYLYTGNPDTASGDGIAMAWRAVVEWPYEFKSVSIRLAFMTQKPRPFYLWKPFVAKVANYCCLMALALWVSLIKRRGPSHHGTSFARAIDHEIETPWRSHVLLDIFS